MGAQASKKIARRNAISIEIQTLCDLEGKCDTEFPGYDYHPADSKNWMSGIRLDKILIRQIDWPGTHDFATNKISIPFVT